MPQTLTGWILFVSILLSGMGVGVMAAAMLDDALGDKAIKRQHVAATALCGALLLMSGLLLFQVEGS